MQENINFNVFLFLVMHITNFDTDSARLDYQLFYSRIKFNRSNRKKQDNDLYRLFSDLSF